MLLRSCVFAFILACGANATLSEPQTTSSDEGSPCSAELSECYDEGSRASCLEVAESCEDGHLVELETCPVQYACQSEDEPSASADEPVANTVQCAGHSPTEPCMNEENFAECQRLETECPGSIVDLESCPLQFACAPAHHE